MPFITRKAFLLPRSHIPGCKIFLRENPRLGLVHLHAQADGSERAFACAFHTACPSDDGRAHALEHLCLRASDKFPGQDPFFAMAGRSAARDMNAFTANDHTCYHFSTDHPADFHNLLEVYLDGIFRPLLLDEDFAQEALRLEISGKRASFGGVVFNEMQACCAEPSHIAARELRKTLLPGHPGAFEAGGEPFDIAKCLRASAIREFHAERYAPEKALFLTFGPDGPEAAEAAIEAALASRNPAFGKPGPAGAFPLAPASLPAPLPGAAPIGSAKPVPLDVPGEAGNPPTLCAAWALGDNSDPLLAYEASVFSALFLHRPGALFPQLLQTLNAGTLSSPSGVQSDGQACLFFASVCSADPEAAQAALAHALEDFACKGPNPEVLEQLRRDWVFGNLLEYASKETPGQDLLLDCASALIRGQSLPHCLDDNALAEQAISRFAQPGYAQEFIRRHFLAAPCALAALRPGPGRERSHAEILRSLAQERLAIMDEPARKAHKDLMRRMRARSAAEPGDALPRLAAAELAFAPAPELPAPCAASMGACSLPAWILPVPELGEALCLTLSFGAGFAEPDQWPWIELYAALAPDMPLDGLDSAQTAQLRNAQACSFGAGFERQRAADGSGSLLRLSFHAQGLARQSKTLSQALAQAASISFSDLQTLAYRIAQIADAELAAACEDSGELSRLAACSGSPEGRFAHAVSGAPWLTFLRRLRQSADTPRSLAEIAKSLGQIHRLAWGSPRLAFACGDPAACQSALAELGRQLPDGPGLSAQDAIPEPAADAAAFALALRSQSPTNSSCLAFHAPETDPDSFAAYECLSMLIEPGLHAAVREDGGAYGAECYFDFQSARFCMASQADPELDSTREAFLDQLRAAAQGNICPESLGSAQCRLLAELRRPKTPLEAASVSWERFCGNARPDFSEACAQAAMRLRPENLAKLAETLLSRPAAFACSCQDSRAARSKIPGLAIADPLDFNPAGAAP